MPATGQDTTYPTAGTSKDAECAEELAQTAFRLREKQYQLHKVQQLKQSKGRVRGGKLTAKPTDFSDVLDFHSSIPSNAADSHPTCSSLPPGTHLHVLPRPAHAHHPPAADTAPSASVGFQPPLAPSTSSQQHPGGLPRQVTAVTFDAHPGLVYLPSAVPPHMQLQLMAAAFLQWPQPPGRSNHTLKHPALPDLWRAAQAGLHLRSLDAVAAAPAAPPTAVAPEPPQQGPDGSHPAAPPPPPSTAPAPAPAPAAPATAASAPRCPVPVNLPPTSSAPQHPVLPAPSRLGPAAATACNPPAHGATPPSATTVPVTRPISCSSHLDTHQQPANLHPGGSHRPMAACWQQGGPGPAATKLLQKLRWVSLGPPYNWTTRLYEPQQPHTPLPSVLQQAALLYAELAQLVLQGQCGGEAAQQQAAGLQQQQHQQSQQPQGDPQHNGRPGEKEQQQQGVASCSPSRRGGLSLNNSIPDVADGTSSTPASAASVSPFHPDAALVNYYREGDTLGGHKDDVEPDMSQPIVSISLGCPAVFLMGGESREVGPTPLLLHSGDVLVLGGPARRCYHGVPRVLTDDGLPESVRAAAAAALMPTSAVAPAPAAAAPGAPGAEGGHGQVAAAYGATQPAAASDPEAGPRELAAVVEYMSSARINISIRAIA